MFATLLLCCLAALPLCVGTWGWCNVCHLDMQVGVDFAPHARSCRMKSMHNFSYKPDAMVAASLDTFLRAEWNGFLQRRDLFCSPYTMTADGMFILDQLPGFPQISLFTGGNGRAFKFSVLLGR